MKFKAALQWMALCVGSLTCQAGNAAEIRVLVTDRQVGNALALASVCLGTPADPVQFGGQFTGENGYAVFENIPATPLILVVSRPEYTGYQRWHPAKRFDITLGIRLATGGLGPVCDLGEVVVPTKLTDGPLTIPEFHLDRVISSGDVKTVTLNAVVLGNPTHYRVSEHWAFEGVEWIEYKNLPIYKLSTGRGEKQVYFQVRRLKELDGGKVESLSGIAQAAIFVSY